MYRAAKAGFSTATDLADYLVKRGLPFRDAHEAVAQLLATIEQMVASSVIRSYRILGRKSEAGERDHEPAESAVALGEADGRAVAQRLHEPIECHEVIVVIQLFRKLLI